MSRLVGLIVVALVVGLAGSAEGKTIHVKAGGTGDGSSWATAYGELQLALDDADPNDDIWVAEGRYIPTELFDPCEPRSATFQMKNNVGIYGGFSSTGEPNSDDRDWEKYETVLSGDLLGNDVEVDDPCDLPYKPSRADNCHHIFYHPEGTDLDTSAVLDGFAITGGNASGDGSGFPWNHSNFSGGMYNQHSSPTVTNCTFSGNLARYGGGMKNDYSSPTVFGCTFTGNSATWGGGMYNHSHSNPTVTECSFSGNGGSGMINMEVSSPSVTNCTFTGNSSYLGGGILNSYYSNPTVTGCTFIGNWCFIEELGGGGMYNNKYSCPLLTNCIFTGNSANYGGGIYNRINSSPTVTNCTFTGNSANYGGGAIYNSEDSDTTVSNCTFSGNSTPIIKY